MRIATIAEILVCESAIASADGLPRVVECPAGQSDAERDEGFLLEATGELLPSVFIEKISKQRSVRTARWQSLDRQNYLSLSKEEGRGAADISKYDVESRETVDTVCRFLDHEVMSRVLELLCFQRIVAAGDRGGFK